MEGPYRKAVVELLSRRWGGCNKLMVVTPSAVNPWAVFCCLATLSLLVNIPRSADQYVNRRVGGRSRKRGCLKLVCRAMEGRDGKAAVELSRRWGGCNKLMNHQLKTRGLSFDALWHSVSLSISDARPINTSIEVDQSILCCFCNEKRAGREIHTTTRHWVWFFLAVKVCRWVGRESAPLFCGGGLWRRRGPCVDDKKIN